MAGLRSTRYRYDVFLSHSSADKPLVRELAEGLRDAGLRVWFDEWIIKPGDLISAKIEEGLEHAALLLFCMSANAFGSDWVVLESHTAIFRDPQNLERRFAPLRLDDAPIKAMLRGYAYLDWRPGADRQREWGRLLEACGLESGGQESGEVERWARESSGMIIGAVGGAAEGATVVGVNSIDASRVAASGVAPTRPSTERKPNASETRSTSAMAAQHRLSDSEISSSVGDPALGADDHSSTSSKLTSLGSHVGDPALTIQLVRSFELFHPGPVNSVCWSPDGSRLVSGGDDWNLRLWEVNSGKELAVLRGHEDWVKCLDWSPDGSQLVSGGFDGRLCLWRIQDDLEPWIIHHPRDQVLSVDWSPDGERLAVGWLSGKLCVLEASSGWEWAVFEDHTESVNMESVNSVCWSKDGTRLASGGMDGTVRLWEWGSGKQLARLKGHKGGVTSVCWNPEGDFVASGGEDGTVRLWKTNRGKQPAVLDGHKDAVLCVCWNPKDSRLLSGGADGMVRVWDARSRKELCMLNAHNSPVRSISWSPDGCFVASGGGDGTVRLWEPGSRSQLSVFEGHKEFVWDVCASPDGTRLASVGDDSTVRLWEANHGKQLMVLEGHVESGSSVCWSPDGCTVMSGGFDGTVRLWEAASGKQLAVLEGHKESVNSVAWSPDGLSLASGGEDGTVRLWEATSVTQMAVLQGHYERVHSVCWSPDGNHVASGGGDGSVRLWEIDSGKQLAVLQGHNEGVQSVCWSPDGNRVASGGGDGTVRLWDVKTKLELAVLEGHKGSVDSLCWSTDGISMVSGGSDGSVRLWDIGSVRQFLVLEGPQDWVTSVGWNSDGSIWAARQFGQVLIWELDPQAIPSSAAASLTYTNAKVLVVGESGAGKTALTRRLATGRFAESDASTIGAWCTHWPLALPTLAVVTSGEPQRGEPQNAAPAAPQPLREIWLWDFGGQSDQRLIHQLFLDRAALVLLLFNAENDQVLEGLRDWQIALRRSLSEPPPQLLVAARTDAGFGASRKKLQDYAAANDCRLLETSARTGDGCAELSAAIAESIPWDQLPRHTSPLLFQQLKTAILRLRDGGDSVSGEHVAGASCRGESDRGEIKGDRETECGCVIEGDRETTGNSAAETLLTYKDLRERLLRQFPNLDDATLRTVLGLLDGPGVLKQLDYGDFVLLKPEWLGVYGQAVVRALKQAEPQLGALPVGAISAAALPFAANQPRLASSEEPVLLAELERQLQERKICLRQGGRLVFPSFCGQERPASPALPPPFMSYAVRGWLDDIHASLVVSLEETRVFQLQNLWRDAAEFRTLSRGGVSRARVASGGVARDGVSGGQALAVQLRRDNASEGIITVHTSPGFSLTEQVQFAQLIHGHLREAADGVQRRRHWLCPHCHSPKGNEAVLMRKLERDGEQARVSCDDCDRPFLLFDELERLLADPEQRRQAQQLAAESPVLTARRKGKLLMLEVGARLTSANQKWQEISPDEDDGLDLQVEFTDDDGNGTGRYLYLQLKAGPSHLRRRADGREIFAIKKSRWIRTWTQQPGPVMLVIGRGAPALGDGEWNDALDRILLDIIGPRSTATRYAAVRKQVTDRLPTSRSDHRAFPDVRWMEISSVLQRELDAGRRPEQIKQIEFSGEPLDLASVLRWRRKILADQAPSS